MNNEYERIELKDGAYKKRKPVINIGDITVNTAVYATRARSAEVRQYASTAANAAGAGSAEVRQYASTVTNASGARSAVALHYVKHLFAKNTKVIHNTKAIV